MLRRWKLPQNYFGTEWPEYYSAGLGQSRDSDALERANFAAMLRALGGESDTVIVVRENHWAVGWVEWIAIHESDAKSIAIAVEANRAMEDYPVLDDELFIQFEDEDCCNTWEVMSWRGRLEYLRAHCYSTPKFRTALAAVRGEWHKATNLLPCPSDLLC